MWSVTVVRPWPDKRSLRLLFVLDLIDAWTEQKRCSSFIPWNGSVALSLQVSDICKVFTLINIILRCNNLDTVTFIYLFRWGLLGVDVDSTDTLFTAIHWYVAVCPQPNVSPNLRSYALNRERCNACFCNCWFSKVTILLAWGCPYGQMFQLSKTNLFYLRAPKTFITQIAKNVLARTS